MSLKELGSIRHVPTRVKRLLEYSAEQTHSDAEEALAAAHEAVRLCQAGEARRLRPDALRTLGLGLYYQRRYQDAFEVFDEARILSEKSRDYNALARCLQNMGVCQVRLGQPERALQHYLRSEELFRRSNDDSNRALVLINLAVCYTTLKNQLKAFELYSQSLELFEKLDDERGIAAVSGNLGQMFTELGEHDKGLQWMERCLEIQSKLNNQGGVAFAWREIGSLHQRIGNTLEAHQNFRKALNIYEQMNDLVRQAETHFDMATILELDQSYAQALQHCLEARRLFSSLQDQLNAARTFNLEGRLLSGQRKHNAARDAYREAVTRLNKTENHAQLCEFLLDLTECLTRIKQSDEAQTQLNKALKIAERLGLLNYAARAHNIASAMEEKEGRLQNALRQVRKAQEAQRQYEQQLSGRKVQDLKYRVDIAKVERDRELIRQQSEEYRAQLENKSKELNASALSLAQKNEVISSLKQRINSLARNNAEVRPDTLRDLVRIIDEQVRGDKQMEGVTKQLSDFHQDFIARLSAEFKELTPTEIKICSLLKLNLNTKEIADFLCVSFKSVEVYRARIRKKLGLSEGENLTAFIVGYDAGKG